LAITSPSGTPRELHAIGSSLKDLGEMPLEIRRAFGRALRAAQNGAFPEDSRPFGEGLDRDHEAGGEPRRRSLPGGVRHRVPRVRLPFARLSEEIDLRKATPRPEIATIEARWKAAKDHHRQHHGSRGEKR
jgi:hypothetical protein